jgi:uncharacterized membrane protein
MSLIIVGSFIIIIGLIFKFFPPKKINSFYGWRSNFSMKNQDVWDEAQRTGSILLVAGGCALLLAGLVVYFLLHSKSEIVTLVGVVATFIVIFVTGEIRLHRIFNKDGSRKS